ncbi:MAG: sigma-54 dependent transcriptional regulator [Pseudomonadota bacterium]|nr:sigma-54 dependent transcriptional regulator [Pseudomonadota bacterium]
MSKAHALVVDDETDILDLFKITLARMHISCRTAANLAQAKRLLTAERFDLCLTDMRLPDGSGIELVRHIGEILPDLPVAMITAHGNMESAVAAMKAGAFDFVSKPLDLQLLRRLVESALRLRASPARNGDAEESTAGTGLLGDSPQMRELRGLIAKLARSQAPVFVSGESGTGKELAARLIHAQGPRAESAFVPVNCGAIPQELVESELFGHKKGSFTGAVGNKEGLFHAAEGGTLFLDEVADLPLNAQVKLLRAIQEKSVRPVGAQHEVPVDVRIISASHRDLNAEVEKGSFRQDLFYRINVIELRMPPLRERPPDIPSLANHILERIVRQSGQTKPVLESRAVEALERYPFPGNVRELENILERAIALSDGDSISAADLYLPQADSTDPAHAAPTDAQPLEDYLDEVEKHAIVQALEETRWNRTAAAKKLGMTLRSLRYRLSKLGIE